MNDRDKFAAAALCGLLAQGDDGSFSEESYARAAYRWADVMLAVRGSQTPNKPVPKPMPEEKRAEVSDTEPVAWAVTIGDGGVYEAFAAHQYDEAASLARQCLFGTSGPLPLAPLYLHSKPTLAADERDALLAMAAYMDTRGNIQMQAWGSLLRILERRLA